MVGKGSMRKHYLCTIFKLYTNSFSQQRAGLKVLIKVTAQPIFLLYLSLTSELWLRSWMWSKCRVSPEFLRDLNPLKNKVKWQVRELPSMTARCAVLRELFLIRLLSIIYFYYRKCSERDKFKLKHLHEKFYMKKCQKWLSSLQPLLVQLTLQKYFKGKTIFEAAYNPTL